MRNVWNPPLKEQERQRYHDQIVLQENQLNSLTEQIRFMERHGTNSDQFDFSNEQPGVGERRNYDQAFGQ